MKLTVSEAATLLGNSEQRVYDWIEEDALPAQKIRGQYRINRTDLLEWATKHDISVNPSAFRRDRGTPSLADALRAGGVHHRIDGPDLPTILRVLVEQLPLTDHADREMLLSTFRLAPDSRAINSGAYPDFPPFDIDGEPRFMPNIDIGADEYHATPIGRR